MYGSMSWNKSKSVIALERISNLSMHLTALLEDYMLNRRWVLSAIIADPNKNNQTLRKQLCDQLTIRLEKCQELIQEIAHMVEAEDETIKETILSRNP